ncbi:hypothetical protein SAMD00079811_33520 [Scytonema sp. HK-05]|uniref:hypothetical protein n=1 Tax=Scytonema sp. HK-05 TaxID=1137095 RepID=UPI000A4EE7F3|nr:hypothetical protein [Scytonema sp. HK-05]BAY45745.1 hypothetical protein SAMD00079811_33520 [Scytonema sp. HK-05]
MGRIIIKTSHWKLNYQLVVTLTSHDGVQDVRQPNDGVWAGKRLLRTWCSTERITLPS